VPTFFGNDGGPAATGTCEPSQFNRVGLHADEQLSRLAIALHGAALLYNYAVWQDCSRRTHYVAAHYGEAFRLWQRH
jgi:hypothetical protein